MLNLLIRIKSCNSALGQPLRMAAHALDCGDSSNQCRRVGKRLTMVMMFVGGLCWCLTKLPHYSYHTKPMKQEFFVSTQTQIVVKLLKSQTMAVIAMMRG